MEATSSVDMTMLEKVPKARVTSKTNLKFIKEKNKRKKDQGFILSLNTDDFPDKSNEI